MKRFALSLLLIGSTSSFAAVNSITANVNNQVGVAGYALNLYSHHHINITNTSTASEHYFVTFNLCPEAQRCKTLTRDIFLNPGQNYTENKNLEHTVSYHVPGNKGLTATTTVNGTETKDATHMAFVRIDR